VGAAVDPVLKQCHVGGSLATAAVLLPPPPPRVLLQLNCFASMTLFDSPSVNLCGYSGRGNVSFKALTFTYVCAGGTLRYKN
jgi:hypothetical protein